VWYNAGMNCITAGLDEVGRGPLAGRVYAACVILDPGNPVHGLDDSKKLSSKKRAALISIIKTAAVAWSVGWADEREIEEINILRASHLAMQRALDSINHPYDIILVDGNIFPFGDTPGRAVIGGDKTVPEIQAASIIAKETRDQYMRDLGEVYPGYGFEKHMGYPTKLHREMIAKLGVTPVHRRTFRGVKEYIK
jgi:ribonuclease HII